MFGPAHSQDRPAGERTMAIEPRLSVSETFTDNHDLSSVRPEADAITRLTAGVGWRGRTGAVRGFLDYALTSVLYARHSDRNGLQNALSANLVADVVDGRLQVVTAAGISRSAISAFGVQPGGGGDANANTTETRNLQITPSLRGLIGPEIRYTAEVGHSISSSGGAGVGDSSATTASLHIEPTSRAKLGWSGDASSTRSDFKQGRSTQADRLYGGLNLNLDELDLQLKATVGTERNNLSSLDATTSTTWGVGGIWTPSPVTRVSADMENRFFGRSHALSIEHRTPSAIFRVRSARSLTTDGSQLPSLRGVARDLLFDLLASAQPDRQLREARVDQLLRELDINPTRVIDSAFLRSAVSVQDQLSFSAAWNRPRHAVVLTASRSSVRRVDTLSSAVDDLSRTGEVRTSSLSLDLSHRLTPLSSLSFLLGVQRSDAAGGQAAQADLSSRQTQADFRYSVRLARDNTFSASLRRAHFNTGLRSYDETALIANFGVRF